LSEIGDLIENRKITLQAGAKAKLANLSTLIRNPSDRPTDIEPSDRLELLSDSLTIVFFAIENRSFFLAQLTATSAAEKCWKAKKISAAHVWQFKNYNLFL
jgi:hypothetical protein